MCTCTSASTRICPTKGRRDADSFALDFDAHRSSVGPLVNHGWGAHEAFGKCSSWLDHGHPFHFSSNGYHNADNAYHNTGHCPDGHYLCIDFSPFSRFHQTSCALLHFTGQVDFVHDSGNPGGCFQGFCFVLFFSIQLTIGQSNQRIYTLIQLTIGQSNRRICLQRKYIILSFHPQFLSKFVFLFSTKK